MKYLSILIFLIILNFSNTIAQVPETEIFLIDINSHGDHVHLGQPVNITNRPGYDNQPYFLPDGTGILFTSIEENAKADIYKYTFADNSISKVISTENEAEYSPVLTPDGKYISVVQVESDDSTQRIWKFPLDGGKPELVFKNNRKVGYYTWLNSNEVYAFVLGEPFTLQHLDLKKKKSKVVAVGIGRSVQTIPGKNAVSFVHKEGDIWTIKMVDEKGAISKIIETLEGEEDYAWMADGTLLMGKEGILYEYKPGRDNEWKVLANLSKTPAKNFYRIAASPDGKKIALVAYTGEKP